MVRRVKGPTDHVVIVGAGLGGLSAALRFGGGLCRLDSPLCLRC